MKPAIRGFASRLARLAPPATRLGIACGVAAAALFALAASHRGITELLFARSLYPVLTRLLSRATATVPWSLAELVDAAILASIVLAAIAGARRIRRTGGSFISAVAAVLLAAAGVLGAAIAAFVLLWGLNYARRPIDEIFELPHERPGPDRIQRIADEIGVRIDRLRKTLPEDEHGVAREPHNWRDLDAHLSALEAEVLEARALLVVRRCPTKRALLSRLFLRWGVSGFYSPFTAETHIVLPSAPCELPFALAHEQAHLEGFAREDEASFIALLTVWRSDRPEVRYSGWLELWLGMRLPLKTRDPGVVRDVRAIGAFIAEHAGREEPTTRKVYDSYLKAVGVKEGVASYGGAVDLAMRYLAKNGLPPEDGAA